MKSVKGEEGKFICVSSFATFPTCLMQLKTFFLFKDFFFFF